MQLAKQPTKKISSSFTANKPRKTLKNREKINSAKGYFNPYNSIGGVCNQKKRELKWTLQAVWVYSGIDWVCPVLEGCYLSGRERGLWKSKRNWFEVMKQHGNSYSRESLNRYYRGLFRYISNEVITLNLFLTGLTIVEAYQYGLAAAQEIKERYQ